MLFSCCIILVLIFESMDEILNHGYKIDLGRGGEGIPRNYWRGSAACSPTLALFQTKV